MNYTTIINNIKNKKIEPLYFIGGEELFLINKICKEFETSILSEEEKDFNMHILYGKEVKYQDIINVSKQFPVNSKYSVVIIKEAEKIKNLDEIKSYLESLNRRCVLVFSYNKKINERSDKNWKLFSKYGIAVNCKKIYDNKVPEWIKEYIKSINYEINYKSCLMISESLGNDLSKISNEIQKLIISIGERKKIEENDIQNYIGINKDYNVYELINAIGLKDAYKTYLISEYLYEKDSRNMLYANSSLHDFFTKVLLFQNLKRKKKYSENLIVSKLNLPHAFFLKQYSTAAINYNSKKIINILETIFEYERIIKGLSTTKNTKSLVKEVMYKILN